MLKSIELSGFKSFAKKATLDFTSPIAGIVGPNGSGKSNTAEAFRFVLGEQSMKAMRGKRGPDMIWSGNERQPRANRARVAVMFDNRSRMLDIDFDEVVIERIVHRDGANEYTINGSKVRLKDVTELLASANVGASGHHIISQGEADRILGASERDRREMIEEALGLKTFQFKKTESEKKLEKTAENMKEVAGLRRELAPHMKFLEKQMQKLERSRELKTILQTAYSEYIAHERAFLREEAARIGSARTEPMRELERIKADMAREERPAADKAPEHDELNTLDERTRAIAEERSKLEHSRGRVEGQIALVNGTDEKKPTKAVASVPFEKVEEFLGEVEESVTKAKDENNMSSLMHVVTRIGEFLNQFKDIEETHEVNTELAASLAEELRETEEALAALETESAAVQVARENALNAITEKQQQEKEAQRRYFELKDEKREVEHTLERVARDEQNLGRVRQQLTVIEHKAQDLGVPPISEPVHTARSRDEQFDAMRDIEKLEARLEEAGVVDEDTVHEYEETKKRDEFLARELEDLDLSKKTLLEVIGNLEGELSSRFGDGLSLINSEFKKFFAMLFDGGDAELKLVKKTKKNEDGEEVEDEEAKEGIEIKVQLPRKKVAALDVLSGGERALTSIALIFAMSQVNPPPFIILDETDAALDEANSRKYADMVRALSERSQLILITHNRQTMEAAGELYGVTMGNDGVSKLLSVKFDEAISVAK